LNTIFYKTLGLFLFILQAACYVGAQNITRSPYSVVGAGDIVFSGNVNSFSMGRVAQGIRRHYEINRLNPASYSNLLQTNIEIGAIYGLAKFSSLSQQNQADNSWLAYINMAMPISAKKGIGFSFGLAPFTSVGYNTIAAVTLPSDTFNIPASNRFIGSGGLSKAYLGYGMRLYKNLSLGINAAYVFGQINQKQQLIIPATYNMFNLEESNNTFANGFVADLGIQYHTKFKNDILFTYGATLTPQANLNAAKNRIVRTLPVGLTAGTRDTIINQADVKGSVNMPLAWQTGFSIEKENKWLLAADVNGANWGNYRSFNVSDSLQNSMGFNFGASVVPNYGATKNILNKLEYRAGFAYQNTGWQFMGNNIEAMSVTCGIGIPLVKSKSKVSVGFEYTTRGTTQNNLIKEEYYRFILGISFSDKWVYRYRYD